MASEKQFEANRRNAQLSTGPKSQEGKDTSRFNALTHGLRAISMDVLPGECPKEFGARLEAWNDDCRPNTAATVHLVRQLAILTWKMDRIDRYELTVLSKRVHDAVMPCLKDSIDHIEDPDLLNSIFMQAVGGVSFDPSNEGERLRRYQFSLQRAFLRTLDALTKLRKVEGKNKRIDANEAKMNAPIKANEEIGKNRTGTRPPEELDWPYPTERPGAGPIFPQPTPNKANLAPRVQATSGSVAKSTIAPRLNLGPIEAKSTGWLDISCLKS
jgi:hypothetical protein